MIASKVKLQTWYAEFAARKMAMLPADVQDEIVAFERSAKRNKTRWLAAMLALWLAAAFGLRLLVSDMSWAVAIGASALLLASTLVAVASTWFGHHNFRVNFRALSALLFLATAAAVIGGFTGRFMKHGSFIGPNDDLLRVTMNVLLAGLIMGAAYGLLLFVILQHRRRMLQAKNETLTRQAQEERVARRWADARLKLMQAQVEPHFLFNTLASVQELAEGKAPEAATLTQQLITFLRAGLAGLRDDTTTLAREFSMLEAFLTIMKTRMGDRLSFELDLPDALAEMSMPPAMLISLVENAIKHGLEPALEGGHLRLSARSNGAALTVAVQDTGLGLGAPTSQRSGGVGLANIRERLAAIYGDDATLSVRENLPRGVIAMISINAPYVANSARIHR